MKIKIFSIIMMLLFSLAASAQFSVTKFLGIPVDGFKKDMIKKLEAKGYEHNLEGDYLTGEFNGRDVMIFINTNNNKVCRITVANQNPIQLIDLKTQFNNLVSQFEKNKRYTSLSDNHIAEDVDINYEMTVHHKKFEAIFYQMDTDGVTDTLTIAKQIHDEVLEKYTSEELEKKSAEDLEKIGQEATYSLILKYLESRPVWFTITENNSGYNILLFYDNQRNRANGEDL